MSYRSEQRERKKIFKISWKNMEKIKDNNLDKKY